METAQKPVRTIRSILYRKTLDALEKTSLEKIRVQSIKFMTATTLSIGATSGGLELLQKAISYNSYAPLRVAGVFAIVYTAHLWIPNILEEIRENSKKFENTDENSKIFEIEGIDPESLLDFIFEKKGFPGSDARKELGISKQQVERISKGLESVGVFIRGANNARVLDERYSREDINSILEDFAESGEWRKLTRQESESSFTHSPTFDRRVVCDEIE